MDHADVHVIGLNLPCSFRLHVKCGIVFPHFQRVCNKHWLNRHKWARSTSEICRFACFACKRFPRTSSIKFSVIHVRRSLWQLAKQQQKRVMHGWKVKISESHLCRRWWRTELTHRILTTGGVHCIDVRRHLSGRS